MNNHCSNCDSIGILIRFWKEVAVKDTDPKIYNGIPFVSVLSLHQFLIENHLLSETMVKCRNSDRMAVDISHARKIIKIWVEKGYIIPLDDDLGDYIITSQVQALIDGEQKAVDFYK